MTAKAGPEAGGTTAHGPVDFYRQQARLMWEWRPDRLALIRRAILSYLMACASLAITSAFIPGLDIDGPAAVLLAALLLLSLDSLAAVILHWLFVAQPLFVAQILGLAVQVLAIVLVGRVVPGVTLSGSTTAVVAAILLTVINSFLAELVAVSDDDSYYGVLMRRLVARNFGRRKEEVPGLLMVQIDGLSRPALEDAIRGGRAPVLGGLLRKGWATLHGWSPMLPPTTPASQAGILHGRNDGIAGFRWYEKAAGRLMVANHPEDAAEIVRRVSDGHGLLSDDGASVGNLVTGDAARSYLTMATIAVGSPTDDGRRLRGFLATSVNYTRLFVLMAGEVFKELYQAERQRTDAVEPRIHRDLHYAIERAVSNIAMRTVSTAFVIEEMYCGTSAIYVDYTGYDAISHHCGPQRQEAIDALAGIDRAIGSLLKAGKHAMRDYRLVVLSDHGQALGATFRQRFGEPLEETISDLLPGPMTVIGTTQAVESAGMGRRMAAEIGRGSGVAPFLARRMPAGFGRYGEGSARPSRHGHGRDSHEPPPDVVVASSGSLAHVYFTSRPGHVIDADIEAAYPDLIEGLAHHAGIAVVIVRTAQGGVVAADRYGRHDLSAGPGDPGALADFGPGAADDLRHLASFETSGDLMLLGAIDRVSGEITGFEELVGSHGGLGGWQGKPFILVPESLRLSQEPLVGAPAIYRQLTEWQAQLRAAPSASGAAAETAAATPDAAGQSASQVS